MDTLVFRLYGAMASWGEIAVGENRHTANHPSKSAIIGLLAAALGIKRDDEEQQNLLQQGYALAVEVIFIGQLLSDYHSTQVPRATGKINFHTRRDEIVLGKKQLGTILSSREYRSDTLVLVAIQALETAPYSLVEIKKQLLKPKFHLYLGRKSCPLAAPLDPQLIKQTYYYDALKAYQHKPMLPAYTEDNGNTSKCDIDWLGKPKGRHYYWEGQPGDFTDSLDLTHKQTHIRHDQPLSRKRWQFSPRQEHYLFIGGGE